MEFPSPQFSILYDICHSKILVCQNGLVGIKMNGLSCSQIESWEPWWAVLWGRDIPQASWGVSSWVLNSTRASAKMRRASPTYLRPLACKVSREADRSTGANGIKKQVSVILSLVVLLAEPKPTFPPDTVALHTNTSFYSYSPVPSLQNELLLKLFVSIIYVHVTFSINFFPKNFLRSNTRYWV